ncbi:GntR family transcriptional regulator [Clostridium manihotivorum]|uniref:GntR family transcriptional regulator n=1 Tax=Clostridium manihotivorum TaxID=2320868 RepID=A0A410DZD7_9CLOT|nr:GntR family transcriptional regulator [Clostridium manihotivorum]QAA34441.1 GntR family transcriptional regulator [Clostridium manihotivorum]
MLIKIDFQSEVPIYLQLKNQIIHGIASGELQPEESLPSVRQMAEDIGINLHTVNKGYNLLKDEGFVTIDRRKGAIVNSIPIRQNDKAADSLKEELKNIIAQAYCFGISKDDFINECKKMYCEYEK